MTYGSNQENGKVELTRTDKVRKNKQSSRYITYICFNKNFPRPKSNKASLSLSYDNTLFTEQNDTLRLVSHRADNTENFLYVCMNFIKRIIIPQNKRYFLYGQLHCAGLNLMKLPKKYFVNNNDAAISLEVK